MEWHASFWEQKYLSNNLGWDLGAVSPPIKKYVDSLDNKEIKILIPGGGNSYEAEYLYNKGFGNVYVVDIVSIPLQNLKKRVFEFPSEHLYVQDFFSLQGEYDLIIEQTFFCALDPKLRTSYCQKMTELLKPSGLLAGLLFDAPLHEDHPPFGGSKDLYIELFSQYFVINHMERATNSAESRDGMELFFEVSQKRK